MRACVESVLVLSLMKKLRPLLEAEDLMSAFTKVLYVLVVFSLQERFRTFSDAAALGPIRTSGQVLNVITFLTKTKLSRQVRDILKKTKGVIIITIALHVLLASWYISRHGRLVQISNNQAGPRGEIF